ncbi:MAG TPA: hypothetical protein VNO81_08815, partial [Candidatus Nitrosotenuis sp.]|nr:hypothetical protein [Candidatus Nitrosotenuis sp.]
LEAAQQGTLAGFLGPLREALVSYQETVEQLHPAGGWDPELWQQLETAQFSVLRGNEGLAFLAQHLHGLLLEKMQTDPDLRAELEAQAEAERQEAELADSETRPGQNIPDTPVVPPGL